MRHFLVVILVVALSLPAFCQVDAIQQSRAAYQEGVQASAIEVPPTRSISLPTVSGAISIRRETFFRWKNGRNRLF